MITFGNWFSRALIVRRRGPRSPSCPAPGDLVLLPDPGLVPEPNLYPVAIDPLVARGLEVDAHLALAPVFGQGH